MNPTTEEEKYWREHHEKQPFVKSYTYAHYAPAYRTGYEGFHKYPGKAYEESKAIWRSTTSEIKPNRRFPGTMLGTRCMRPGPNSAMI
jgi:hypothetical protein